VETIHYVSDFVYFSGRKVSTKYGSVIEALRSHIKYISRKAKGVKTFNLNINDWVERAKNEIVKRWDSRVALKFVMALPLEVNEQNSKDVGLLIETFIAETFNVDPKHIGIAIHLHKGVSGNYNPHAHILIFPRTKDGKKLRLNRKDLSEFHRKWEQVLKEIGYRVRKNPENERLPHLGSKLYYDQEAQELYRLYLEIKEDEKRLKTLTVKQNHSSLPEAGEGKGREEGFEVKGSFWDRFGELLNRELKKFGEKQKRELIKHFKTLGYKANDKLAVVLVNHREDKVLQRVMAVKEILNDETLRFLRAMNSKGYSVYASINTLKPLATRRRKEDFEEKQRRIYLDLDSKDVKAQELIVKLFQYLELKGLPQPTHIVKSSKGNYQVYWVLDEEIDWQMLERVMEQMNNDLGLDHTQDVSRVFRLPYFRNKKPGKDDLVMNIERLKVVFRGENVDEIRASGKPVSFEPFRKLLEPVKLPTPKPLRVKRDFGKGINEFWERLKHKEREAERFRRLRVLREQGYSESVANYYLKVEEVLAKCHINDEIEELIRLAFERNKDKTPSEIDMSLTGLIFSRYNGEPPKELVKALRDTLTQFALLRDKRKDFSKARDYANDTIHKAYVYWRQKKTEREEVKRTRDKNNRDWFGPRR